MATVIDNFPGLGPGQIAWQVDVSTIVVVEILRRPLPSDAHVAAFQVRAWKAHADGSVALDGNGVALEIPVRAESISLSGLADGIVTVAAAFALFNSEALVRAQTWLSVQIALNGVPETQ